MVYQHFTLVPSLTAAENLVISRAKVPAIIDWTREKAGLGAFMETMPFSVPLDVPVARLAAGEKQKLELLKQLYLGRRFLILDEPTSVLTPAEADELLGMVRGLTRAGTLTCLMITHKFREVTAFADEVSVLRRGEHVGGGQVDELDHDDDGGDDDRREGADEVGDARRTSRHARCFRSTALTAVDRSGLKPITIDALAVRSGEIVGIAGVSGNGQMELMEILTGQRPTEAGEIAVKDKPFRATPGRVPRARCALPARGAAAQCLRAADERGRKHRLPHVRRRWRRQVAVLARLPRNAPGAALNSFPPSRSRPPRSTRPSPRSRAAMCSARCWRAN